MNKIYPKSKLNINNKISTESINSIQSDSIQSDSIHKSGNCTSKFVKKIKTIIIFRDIVDTK